MFASGLITFRETLEAALVVGIVLSFLTKTHQDSYKKYVWFGVGLGVALSVLLSIFLKVSFGGLEGTFEKIYEGILMFTTAGFLTWMILWVHRQKGVARKLEQSAAKYVTNKFPLGLTFLILTSVIREGVETVLYLEAISSLGGQNQLFGALVGAVVALSLGFFLFKMSLKINVTKLLKLSGAILLLFAAGLVSHGVHEFQEIGLLPVFTFDPLINISHILDNGSIMGGILRTLFGYTAQPTFLEMTSYAFYILSIFLIEYYMFRKLFVKNGENNL